MSAKAGCEAVLSLAVAGLTLMTVERALPKALNQHRKSLASLAAGVACVAMACALNPPAVRYVVNPFELAPHHWFALYLAKTAVRARRSPSAPDAASLAGPFSARATSSPPPVLLLPALPARGLVAPRSGPRVPRLGGREPRAPRAAAAGDARVPRAEPQGGRARGARGHRLLVPLHQLVHRVRVRAAGRAVRRDDGRVERGELGLWNTAPALFLVFAIDDAFYAPTHKLMHNYRLYPYIHKHHHRQWLPARGYTDAGNEHPLEQVLGLSCLWATLQIVARLTGLHAATIVVHFTLYAALAMLNHTGCDVRVKLPGFEYTVGAHEMHHRQPNCNMAQYFMFWDKLMGTYKPYISKHR